MKRLTMFLAAIALSVLMALTGCRFPGSSDLPVAVVLGESTRVLDDGVMESLSGVSEDGSTFTFDEGAPELDSVEAGDILVLGVTEQTPYGALRRVDSITPTSGQLEVDTSPASIEDAVEEGDLVISDYALQPSMVKSVVAANPGVTFRDLAVPRAALAKTFVVDLHCVPLDGNGDPDDGVNQVTIDGTLEFTLGFELTLKVRRFKLKEVNFAVNAEENAYLQATADLSGEVDASIELGTIKFSTIKFMAGPLPVFITPKVVLTAGADGTVSAEVSTSLTQDASLEPYLNWTSSGGWDSGIGTDFGFDFQQPVASATCGAKVYAGPELQMLLYGVAGPLLGVEAYLEFGVEVSSEGDFGSSLSWGITVNIGASLSAIGNLEDVKIPVFDHSWPIWELSAGGTDVTVDVADGYGYADDPTDTEAFGVLYTVPADGATGADPKAPIGICFDDTVDPATVSGVSVEVTASLDGTAVPISGTLLLGRTSQEGTSLLEFYPEGGWLPTDSPIQVTLVKSGGLEDDGGQELTDAYAFGFETGAASHVVLGFQDDAVEYAVSGTGSATLVEYPFYGLPAIEGRNGLVISTCDTGMWDGWGDEGISTATLSCASVTVPAGVTELVYDAYTIEECSGDEIEPDITFTVDFPAENVTIHPLVDIGFNYFIYPGDVDSLKRTTLRTVYMDLEGRCEPGDQIDFSITLTGGRNSEVGDFDIALLLDAVRFR